MQRRIAARLRKEFSRFNILVIMVLTILAVLLAGAIFGLNLMLSIGTVEDWLPALALVGFALVTFGLIMLLMVGSLSNRVQRGVADVMEEEYGELRASTMRAHSLQSMASTLRATLSFERVVEAALDVCSLTLEEMGIPSRALVGAVLLFEQEELVPVATRRFVPSDLNQRIAGKTGIIGDSLRRAEPVMIQEPRTDPEIRDLLTFQNCETAVSIPLRAGFQLFGVMLLGTETTVNFSEDQLAYFSSVGDHAVIALQNAKLYQDLKAEKQRIIEADEDARKELARDLHDGPTQSVAAIAMRVNFIRTLIERDPEQALEELDKVESLARDTSQEIRGMLFTLRPLVLETEGLAAAVETVIARIEDTHGLPVRFSGKDAADLLDEHAQSVVFSIVEEALGNARKYSEATQVIVRFWREAGLFVAQVRDNGVGFDVENVNDSYSTRGSLGMVNMRERAERVDGSLRVESTPGKGTTVTLVVPLDKHGARPLNRRRRQVRV